MKNKKTKTFQTNPAQRTEVYTLFPNEVYMQYANNLIKCVHMLQNSHTSLFSGIMTLRNMVSAMESLTHCVGIVSSYTNSYIYIYIYIYIYNMIFIQFK